MKFWAVVCVVVVALSTLGASCVNENITVVVNLDPIVARYHLRGGNDTTIAGIISVKLDSLLSAEYREKIRQGRIYDLKVKVEGNYSGSVSGFVAIQLTNSPVADLLRFPPTGHTPWSNFHSSQSLLGNSPYLAPQRLGIDQLLNALTQRPMPRISLLAFGALSVAPVPDNLYVTIEVYLQADAELN
jgi:hypothetical protein